MAALQHQLDQVVGQDGKGADVQVAIGKLDLRALLDVLHLPGVGDDVE
jgi:hypothetical protein